MDMLEYEPDFCFIQIGGNDISDSSDAEKIAADIINITKLLKERGIHFVVGEVMPRKLTRKPLTPQAYENIRTTVNHILRVKTPSNTLVSFPEIDFEYLNDDGIHLNVRGTEVFVNTIKREINKYLFRN